MEDSTFRPPSVTIDCPRCGAKADWRPPAIKAAATSWQLDYECTSAHRLTVFVKPKTGSDPDHAG